YLGTTEFVAQRTSRQVDAATLADMRGGGGTVVVLATPERLLAAFVLEDTLRPGAAELVAELNRRGKRVVLLTGDHAEAARHVADALGIEDVHAGLKPADKLAHVQRLQAAGAVVAMVGDGVNDAPVLAAAQVSIAIGGGAYVSAASADMILLSPDLRRLAQALRIARRTLVVIRENLAWAAVYNVLAVPVAAAGLVTPWM